MTTRCDYYACPCGHHDYAVMRRIDQGCVPDHHRYVDMPTCATCGNEFFDAEPARGYPCDCHRGPVDDEDGNLCAQCLAEARLDKSQGVMS